MGNEKLNTIFFSGVLVGDGGYPSSASMLTPLQNPNSPAEVRYNYAQIRTRNIVERTFGVWKKIFPCLQVGLKNKLATTCNIIIACAVLHNLRITLREEIPTDAIHSNNDELHQRTPQPSDEGLAFRQSIINNYFS